MSLGWYSDWCAYQASSCQTPGYLPGRSLASRTTFLAVFRFDEDLSLWCVPFDLESAGFVKGEWQGSFRYFPRDEVITAQSGQPNNHAFIEC